MKKFLKQISRYEKLLFLDLEGTQESHELIAISGVLVALNDDHTLGELQPGFKVFVQPHHRIGHYVKKLTGITTELLANEGVSYASALEKIVEYCGGRELFNTLAFVTFGNHDLRIFHQSLIHSPEADATIVRQIASNNIDLSAVLAEFVKDDNGNPLSLANYCEKFEVPFVGTPHDPYYDALNLARLYNAFITREDLLFMAYKHTLSTNRKLPPPMKAILDNLLKGEGVTSDDLDEEITRYLAPNKGKK